MEKREEFDRLVNMYFLEEKMKMLYSDMIDLADEQDNDDLVAIGAGLFKIYERCSKKLKEMRKSIDNGGLSKR